MKNWLILLVFALGMSGAFAQPNVRVCQVEYVRDNGFQPDYSQFPDIAFIQLSPKAVGVAPNVSSHATDVARILTSGPAAGLVSTIYICEAVTFTGRGQLNGGRTLPPGPSSWEIENHSWGGNDILATDDILAKEDERILRDNILAFVGPPNGGQGYVNVYGTQVYQRLLSCVHNAVRVGSTITGMDLTAESMPDVYEPVAWTSYDMPTAAETGIAMVSWCKAHGVNYSAQTLKHLIIINAKPDSQGRPVVDHEATMSGLKAYYSR
jgi:hypothetical protein